jgi:murein DD-endopeptidase MepM/ murein hydrolase activator NlpD
MPISDPLRRSGRRIAAAAFLLGASMTTLAAPGNGPDESVSERPTFSMPLEVARVTSGFATRRHPIKKKRHHHAGVDFAAPLGAPVRTVDDGEVTFAGTQGGYGNVVYIRHAGRDRTTLYAHLDRIDVRKGQSVQQGEAIGTVGATGLATGPHLHFEVHEGGKPIDPLTLAFEAVAGSPGSRIPTHTILAPAPDLVAASARCVDLLQKASLEALDDTELQILRQGCIR